MKVAIVFGTRPEAIKMAPVVAAFRADSAFETLVCVTGQHRTMLDQVLGIFGIEPDIDLDIMTPGQSLTDITVRVLQGMEKVIREHRPDVVLVHGDTTTAMAAALAAFYHQVPVGHVEAGLRTRDIMRPWPEEMNRSVIDVVGRWLFAPTPQARQALLDERIDGSRIAVTGNTVIDALLMASDLIEGDAARQNAIASDFTYLDPAKRLLLVTGHRRENFGGGLRRMCEALARLARRGDVQVVYPVHLNENVQQAARETLSGVDDVFLIDPLEYLPFIYLMRRSHLIITDSGGIQEEAPSLGKPVLVTRDVTERPEAVAAGTARLVGTDPDVIVREAEKLLDSPDAYRRVSEISNPYGDGKAAQRILEAIRVGNTR
ncbi:non-hydrolyzing UDP-N-acetylglucosamine 2-epimerase [Neoaquamicrobium sediminum]|uniref:non-hydrolyzing UDP-N-acetylglucosamine 2-epimerase n=1 Tax=Neoaquamicrobium sediminum TaxID=1849104 RepID=UPI0015656171|nr:UDP-N-acetylglucosamine 2-epimerase (non-hydrolyzing) [Mesorhizobium sediminum]NRC53941.1 UDP-N-acetylglucosamine 2-epimerase (non-hydrolyzing) [Mesorhizobium sediminum]